MTDKKLTDEEIINYLTEILIAATNGYSEHLANGGRIDKSQEQGLEMLTEIINIINRQKSEIERQKRFIESQNELIYKLDIAGENATVEAYKEFAERIKMSIKANVVETLCKDVKGVYNAEYVLDDIDNLLKEIVGEEE